MHEGVEEEAFVRMRRERDEGLKEPKLLHQSLQVRPCQGRSLLCLCRRTLLSAGEARAGSFFSSCRHLTRLASPRLAQVNIRAGRLPRGKNGQPYFRTPIHAPTVL